MTVEPDSDGKIKTKEQRQKNPSGKPGEGAGWKEQGQGKRNKKAGELPDLLLII